MKEVLNSIVNEIVKEIKNTHLIEIEASGRHIHLSQEDLEKLFGKGYILNKVKELSQPGQYVCQERVDIIGPKNTIKNVVVLGPVRKETQVEVSLTDARLLGIDVPIRQSGDIDNTPGIKIKSEKGIIEKDKGIIVAQRHIHIEEKDKDKFNVFDGEIVKVKVFSNRPLIFDDVVVRISPNFKTYMHIDFDEANACAFKNGTFGIIIK
ncbi:ethanolamine utilization phosphate acetyltransferase EutD [[Clostridium] colinum]|uniref:ethanolamine utilization phosphate acetyltransferase EutD n=1 Tax=[Clostridium] colinum TaxID=36835 RepID=UPI002024D3A4|nr:ethanolamine utilization phosphate acetyltransferase EutD [[Clostridium] colinum]